MFTQSMTKHVVSLVNEEGGGGAIGNSSCFVFSIRVSHMSRVMQAIERPPPHPSRRFVFQIKYLAQKVRYKYIFLVYDGLYIFVE